MPWKGWVVFAALAALPLTPWMTKYYMLLAFDALLFGTVAMTRPLRVRGLVSFGMRRSSASGILDRRCCASADPVALACSGCVVT